jgi:hypothetical protein
LGKLEYATFKSNVVGTYSVRYGESTMQVTLPRGRKVKISARNFPTPRQTRE